MFRLVCFLLLLSLLFSCTPKSVPGPELPQPPAPPLADEYAPDTPPPLPAVRLDHPQRVAQAVVVDDTPLLSPERQQHLTALATEHFFAPWHLTRASQPADKAFWGLAALGKKQGYSENLQPYPPERWKRLVALQNIAAYPSMAQPAITVRNTDVRVFPSRRPFFFNPALPGEGFPFDNLQNSALWLGSPVLVTHQSTDRAWCFVETATVYGWVRTEDLALAGPDFRAAYEGRSLAALRQDDVSLLSAGRFVGQTRIGALFPIRAANADLTVLVPVRNSLGQAETALVTLTPDQAGVMPLPATSRSVAALADAMAGEQYGWGGLYENRDCSATVRDIFLSLGVWLPRNSSQQAQKGGQLISLDKLGPAAKIEAIRSKGVPLATLLWMPGHIGLYLGLDAQGEPLLLHNMWGVRTKGPKGEDGRAVVGGLVITTLRPGEERPDVRPGLFLERIQGMVLLGR